MRLFSKKENDSSLAVVFDLSSSFVAGSLLLVKKDLSLKVLYSIREPISFKREIKSEDLLSETLKIFDKIAGKISSTGLGSPEKFYCVLYSPWYSSQVRSISFKKNTSFLFDQKIADNLIKKEVIKFEEEYVKNKPDESSVRLVELKNMKTFLNGYPANNPFEKKTKDLEMNLYLSMSSNVLLSKLEKIVDKHFHRKEINFSSFAFASFVVARDMFVHQEDFSLVDIGGEVTEICLIKNEALKSLVSFPLGYNYFIRGISLGMKCTLEEAKSFLSLHIGGHMDISLEKKFNPILEKLKQEWLLKFQESLVALSDSVAVSSVVFLTVQEEFSSFFIDIIKKEQFSQYSLTSSKFQVVHLGTKLLHGLIEYNKGVKIDSLVTIEAMYINRFLKSN